ncbi:MAG: hypothetical protein D6B28_04380 [Gammaproteobacteria bacterium]|nr:MAG: hypothetical protein D6B28_04380 [Gammaproteobacteria bacterium]
MKPRNIIALNPLLKKGGAHQKGKSSQRANSRQKLNSYLDEWYEEQTKGEKRKEESNDSSFFMLHV